MTWLMNAIGRRLKLLWRILMGEGSCQSCGRWAPRCHLKIDWKNNEGEGRYEADLCPTCYQAKLREWERRWEDLTRQMFGRNPFEEFRR